MDRVALDPLREADRGGLGNGWMAGWLTSALSTSAVAQAMAGDLDDVVRAADDPEVAVGVLARRVAGGIRV